jgi:uncharacterized Zn-finger protein
MQPLPRSNRLPFARPLLYVPAEFQLPGIPTMAHESTPHFHNTEGLPKIEVGSKEFMCVGALPPFDHPHIYIDMGKDNDVVCSYCSTHYLFNPELAPGTSEPLSAVFHSEPA